MSPSEAVAAMRAANPVATDAVATPEQLPPRVAAAVAVDRRPGARRRVLRPLVIAPVLLAGATGTATAAVMLQPEPARLALSSGCYETASRSASVAVVGDRSATDPVGACRDAWPGAFGRPAPEALSACVTPEGAVAVLPGSQSCAALELAPWSGPAADAEALEQVKQVLSELVVSRDCVPGVELASAARQAIADSGLSGWSVADGTGSCSTPAFDEPRKTVLVVEDA